MVANSPTLHPCAAAKSFPAVSHSDRGAERDPRARRGRHRTSRAAMRNAIVVMQDPATRNRHRSSRWAATQAHSPLRDHADAARQSTSARADATWSRAEAARRRAPTPARNQEFRGVLHDAANPPPFLCARAPSSRARNMLGATRRPQREKIRSVPDVAQLQVAQLRLRCPPLRVSHSDRCAERGPRARHMTSRAAMRNAIVVLRDPASCNR